MPFKQRQGGFHFTKKGERPFDKLRANEFLPFVVSLSNHPAGLLDRLLTSTDEVDRGKELEVGEGGLRNGLTPALAPPSAGRTLGSQSLLLGF